MNKANLSQFLRHVGLLRTADQLQFRLQQWRNRRHNAAFRRSHPNVALPPDYTLFETFRLDYRKYYEGGRNTARWVWNQLQPHLADPDHGRLFDWGCGPARVVRHLPAIAGPGWEVYGADYNRETIEWCSRHIPEVNFSVNAVTPPLPFDDNFFDALYGISIFTHLSEENHQRWRQELLRVMKPGGILLLTTQGEAFRPRLTAAERKLFDQHQLVVRARVKEGHRLYSAFHPAAYVQSLFSEGAEIVRHLPGEVMDWGVEQDTWILMKRKRESTPGR